MTTSNIFKTLPKILLILDSNKVEYWLARGRLRTLYLTGEIGDETSDLDFHIWADDSEKVRNAVEDLFKSWHPDLVVESKRYKLAFYTPKTKGQHSFFVEFMFINSASENGRYVYHERANGKKFAPIDCFSPNRRFYIQYRGSLVRIPALIDKYLLSTYGPEWRKNRKSSKEFNSTPEFLDNYFGKY